MSDPERKKKDGQRKDKKTKAMWEAVKERDREARLARPSTEQLNMAARK